MTTEFLDITPSLPQIGTRVLVYSMDTGELEMARRTLTGFNKANGWPFKRPTHYVVVVAPGETA